MRCVTLASEALYTLTTDRSGRAAVQGIMTLEPKAP